VVQRIGEDDVIGTAQRRDRTDVREVTGGEQDSVLGPLEGGERILEVGVDTRRPADEPRRAGARPPSPRGFGRGDRETRVVGQTEVVVRAQQDDPTSVDLDLGRRSAVDDPR
jgi:hypothetical protein